MELDKHTFMYASHFLKIASLSSCSHNSVYRLKCITQRMQKLSRESNSGSLFTRKESDGIEEIIQFNSRFRCSLLAVLESKEQIC